MTTETSNSRIVGTNQAGVGNIDSGRDSRDNSSQHQRSDIPACVGKSPQWAWANSRSGFDWMDVHLPFVTSEWC